MSLECSKFVERIMNEVRHLRRMNSLRLIAKEDETFDAVDLSRKYFSLQMNDLLDKGAKNIRIRVFEFASPAVWMLVYMAEMGADVRKLTRTPSNVWQFASQRNQSTVITNAITDVIKRSTWIRSNPGNIIYPELWKPD